METENLIPIEQLCTHYSIELSFIQSLTELGLIQITTIEESQFLLKDQIKDLEKMIRLHYDLDINIEGIEAISHLLLRVNDLQHELSALKNRLMFYE
jgi:hypothetical protein